MSLGVLVTVKEPAKASARSSRPLKRNGALVRNHKKILVGKNIPRYVI